MPKNQRLTDKQEVYVRELLKGKSQRKAYRVAYPNSRKWADQSVDVNASRLYNTPKIKLRLDELRNKEEQKIIDKNIWNVEKAVNTLGWVMAEAQKDIQKGGLSGVNSNALINSIKELNKLVGIGAEIETRIELDKARIEKTKSETFGATKDSTQEESLSEMLEDLKDEIY